MSNTFDLWSSMSWRALNTEPADKNVNKEMVVSTEIYRVRFSLRRSMNILNSWLFIKSRSIWDRKSHNFWTIGPILERLNQNLAIFPFSDQNSQPLYDGVQKSIDYLKFVHGVNFELIDSLKNNNTIYLLFFDVSCDEICSSKLISWYCCC